MDGWLSYVKSTVTAVSDEIKQTALTLSEDAAGITFVTKRILAIRGMPFDDSQRVGGATIANPVPQQAGGAVSSASGSLSSSCITVKQLSTFLHKHYPDRFMLWNLSEKTYDYTALDNQVIEFRFPGYPAAPLNQVFALCNSIHAWLTADDNNVAVVHCQTGKGRTICALAWYLAWSGQIATVQNALLHVCGKMGVGPEVIIPTQQRYLDYLSAMLAGKKPSASSVVLERVIMNGIPKLGERLPAAAGSAAGAVGEAEEACRPYLQIFKDGQLLFTSTGRDSTELRWYTARDSCVLFPVGLELEGDILIRVRHLSADNKRISMLRYGFHTGFIAPGNTRFLKPALDGAYNDPRFPRAFWIDMIFRPSGNGTNSEGTESSEDLSTEAGQARRARRELQEKFWQQVNLGRRKTNPAKAAGELITPTTPQPAASPVPATPMTPGANEPTAAAAAPSASASPPPATAAAPSTAAPSSSSAAASSLVTPPKTKPSLGSLFSSASSKLSSMSSSWGAWGSSLGVASSSSADANAAARAEEATHDGAGVLDLSDPEVAKLHAADEEAKRKAKRKAATDAAVQAALQSPHARASPNAPAVAAGGSSSAPRRSAAPAGSDPDSFADLQAYVAGLGSLDARQTEVDSDEEHGGSAAHASASDSSAVSSALHRQDEIDLDRAMQQHFSSEAAEAEADKTKSAAAAAATSPAKPAGAPAIAAATPAKAAAAPVAAPVATPPAAAPTVAAAAALSADAALEAELALLSAGEIDLHGADCDDEVVLDDADEAALLASLQDEMAGE